MTVVPAHSQQFDHPYLVQYPAHEPRADDPHLIDFEEWKRRQRAAGKYRCGWAVQVSDDAECDATNPLEAHHHYIEFALANGVDFAHLEAAFPGISDPTRVGAWIDSDPNLILLCRKHHRGAGAGVHCLDSAMYEASHYVQAGIIGPVPS